MMKYLRRHKKPVTVCLAIAGIGDIGAYISCRDSCSYLQGTLAGFDLKYLGVILMFFLAVLALFEFSRILHPLIAGAVGGELFLVPYQIIQGVLCPFCLVLAFLVLAAFAVNYERPRKFPAGKRWLYAMGEVRLPGRAGSIPLLFFTAVGLLLFVLAFSGPVTPAYGQEPYPGYGSGQVQIRMYTDYLCEPCRALERDIEPLLDKIIAANKARVIFIDTPMHPETIIFTRHYLCATKNAPYPEVVRIRKALFAAAEKGVRTDEGLREFLGKKKIKPPSCDISATLAVMNGYFREDDIKSTPTCVVVTPAAKTLYAGKNDIVAVLKQYAR